LVLYLQHYVTQRAENNNIDRSIDLRNNTHQSNVLIQLFINIVLELQLLYF